MSAAVFTDGAAREVAIEDVLRDNVRLDDENRELRAALFGMLVWISKRSDLLAFMRAEIERRWPEGGAS